MIMSLYILRVKDRKGLVMYIYLLIKIKLIIYLKLYIKYKKIF